MTLLKKKKKEWKNRFEQLKIWWISFINVKKYKCTTGFLTKKYLSKDQLNSIRSIKFFSFCKYIQAKCNDTALQYMFSKPRIYM